MRLGKRPWLMLSIHLLWWVGAVCRADSPGHKLVVKLAVENPGTTVIVMVNGTPVGPPHTYWEIFSKRNTLTVIVPESASELVSIDIQAQAGANYPMANFIPRLYLFSISLDGDPLANPADLPASIPVPEFQLPIRGRAATVPEAPSTTPAPTGAPVGQPSDDTHPKQGVLAKLQDIQTQLQQQSQTLKDQEHRLTSLRWLIVLPLLMGVVALVSIGIRLVDGLNMRRHLAMLGERGETAHRPPTNEVDPQWSDLLAEFRNVLTDLRSSSSKSSGSGTLGIAAEAFATHARETIERLASQVRLLEHAVEAVTRKEPGTTLSNLSGRPVSRNIGPNDPVIRPEPRFVAQSWDSPEKKEPYQPVAKRVLDEGRLQELLGAYEQAVRDPQDALGFFGAHTLQTLALAGGPRPAAGAALKRQPLDPLNAPFWGLEARPGLWWIFPGFSLYSQRSALAAGGWHAAKERFMGLYDLTPGKGFLKRPATFVDSDGSLVCEQPGRIELSDH